MYPPGWTQSHEDGAPYEDPRPGRVFPHKREPAVLALLRAQADACRAQPCQMEAYFNTVKDDAFGGPRVASLVCTCPRCAGRCTL